MTQDIARMESNAVAVLGGANEAMDRLGRWIQAARDAEQLVSSLVGTPFVPDAYRPRLDPRATQEQRREAFAVATANATAAVLQGITLGVDPLVALQQIYIIHGRPGMYAKFMVALVQSHGHEVWTDDLSDSRAVVSGRRKGSEHTETITVTMDMARKAKWTSNAKYQETPQDMLWARAAARVCDRIASDVLKGIASVEEIRDSIQTTAEVGNGVRTVSPRKKASAGDEFVGWHKHGVLAVDADPAVTADPPYERVRITAPSQDWAVERQTQEPAVEDSLLEEEPWPTVQTQPAPTASPTTPDEQTSTSPTRAASGTRLLIADEDDESILPVVGDITGAQSRMMYGLLRTTDREPKEVALVYIAGVIGREIGSTKELSKGEAKKVIDALNDEIAAEPKL